MIKVRPKGILSWKKTLVQMSRVRNATSSNPICKDIENYNSFESKHEFTGQGEQR